MDKERLIRVISIKYEGDVYRPPSEARSLIIQATIGCSHNRCTFCAMYKRKKYRERELDEIIRDIEIASAYLPHTRRIFLADGNALTIETPKLLKILEMLSDSFANLERVTLYGNPHDLLQKTTEELTELGKNKLGMIYLGIESGSAAVLSAVKKGVTPAEMAEGAAKVKKAGIPLSVTVLNGLAGVEGSAEHALASAHLLNIMDPEYIGLLSLMTVPGTTMHRHFEEGHLTPLNPWQLLEEIRAIVSELELTNSVFRANHASNYLPLKANLPRDKQALLANLDQAIARKASGALKSEYMRGF